MPTDPPVELATRLAALSKAKYGYAPAPSEYKGVLRLLPTRVIAWREFPKDATRFVFGEGE